MQRRLNAPRCNLITHWCNNTCVTAVLHHISITTERCNLIKPQCRTTSITAVLHHISITTERTTLHPDNTSVHQRINFTSFVTKYFSLTYFRVNIDLDFWKYFEYLYFYSVINRWDGSADDCKYRKKVMYVQILWNIDLV